MKRRKLRRTKSARQTAAGFSLMEMVIVLAVIATLATIVWPSYSDHADRARRADAQAALTGLSVAMQRYYTEQAPSTYVGATVGSGGIYPNEAPLHGGTKYYDLSIASVSAAAFTVNAAPKGAQAGDSCGTLTLTSTGVKGVSGGTSTWSECWR